MHQNENELIAACLKGDRRAQIALYDRYYAAMYNSALRILKDRQMAEDIMQESFLNAFVHLKSFSGQVPFGAWLKKIVINNSLYQYRKNKKVAFADLSGELKNVADYEPTKDNDLYVKSKAGQILKALNGLKENYRLGLTLHLIEGYDHEEICEITGWSYANCRTTISRAKAQLRNRVTAIENHE